WYGMVVFLNGKAGPETPIHAKIGATFDISNITPITTNPVVTAPTGDSTYARLDGGNQPFTGNVAAPSYNTVRRMVDQEAGSDLAQNGVTCKKNWPAGGGICDASALQGAQRGAATPLIEKANVQVILGCNTTFTGAVNPTISFTANSPSLVGCGMGST